LLFFQALLFVFLGNYMQMMMVLKPIAFDVVIYMTQLFDYYLYSVSVCLVLLFHLWLFMLFIE